MGKNNRIFTTGIFTVALFFTATKGTAQSFFEEVFSDVVDEIKRVPDNIENAFESISGAGEYVIDGTVHVITEAGEEVETFVCELVGKEPGYDCSVSISAEAEVGQYFITDQEGHTSSVSVTMPESTGLHGWDMMIDLHDTETDSGKYVFSRNYDGESYERYILGGTVMFSPIMPDDIRWFTRLPRSAVFPKVVRNDSSGYGGLGARRVDRSGTSGELIYRIHYGTDFEADPGQIVFSPFRGIVRNISPMTTKREFSKIIVESSEDPGIFFKALYVEPRNNLKVGDELGEYDLIGYVDDLHKINPSTNRSWYPLSVENHTHIEYYTVEGYSLDPNGKFAVIKNDTLLVRLCNHQHNPRKCYAPEDF
ncbi:MAG: hypothetical protein RLP12_16360 [Ekhidna sp.]